MKFNERPLTVLFCVYFAALCLIFVAVYACSRDDVILDKPFQIGTGSSSKDLKLNARGGNNQNNNQSNGQDSFIYVPVLYGSKCKVILEAKTPGRKNSYLSVVQRIGQVDPNARFYHDTKDVTLSDTLPFTFQDTFIICRRIKI